MSKIFDNIMKYVANVLSNIETTNNGAKISDIKLNVTASDSLGQALTALGWSDLIE